MSPSRFGALGKRFRAVLGRRSLALAIGRQLFDHLLGKAPQAGRPALEAPIRKP